MTIRFSLFILVASLLIGCSTQAPSSISPSETPAPTEVVAVRPTVSEDASPGEILFKQFYTQAQFACATCHYPDTDTRLLGPGLLSVEVRFDTYDVEAETVEDYIRQSILEPRIFVVPDESPYPENIMPIVYGDIFTDEELDALVEYILSF